MQRTLATDLQKLSLQFRKQQKQHLGRVKASKDGAAPGGWLDTGPSDAGDDYDPGFSDIQVSTLLLSVRY